MNSANDLDVVWGPQTTTLGKFLLLRKVQHYDLCFAFSLRREGRCGSQGQWPRHWKNWNVSTVWEFYFHNISRVFLEYFHTTDNISNYGIGQIYRKIGFSNLPKYFHTMPEVQFFQWACWPNDAIIRTEPNLLVHGKVMNPFLDSLVTIHAPSGFESKIVIGWFLLKHVYDSSNFRF